VRVLVYRLVALPCFRRIRNTFPDAKITVLTNFPVSGKAAPLETILENTGLIDEVIPYTLGLRDPSQLLALRRLIAQEKFDLVVSLAAARGRVASLRDYLFFRACGIPKVIGIPCATSFACQATVFMKTKPTGCCGASNPCPPFRERTRDWH
jgi:heptosyltransferase-3